MNKNISSTKISELSITQLDKIIKHQVKKEVKKQAINIFPANCILEKFPIISGNVLIFDNKQESFVKAVYFGQH